MKKCILWGPGKWFKMFYKVICYYALTKEIEIIGITSNDAFYKTVVGIPFIPKNDIKNTMVDKVIVMTADSILKEIYKEIRSVGIDDRNIVPAKVMMLPGFDFDKYAILRENTPSIISHNCWAGIIYNSLGLEFKSPLINMYEDYNDYLKLLNDIDYYMEQPIEFLDWKYDNYLKKEFPVCRCADVLLYFNHYKSFDEANTYWEIRKKRVNKDNILVMLYGDNDDVIHQFMNLDYERKICFVPYESQEKGLISLDYQKNAPDKPFWQIVNEGAKGYLYDIFELILNNKYVELSSFCKD